MAASLPSGSPRGYYDRPAMRGFWLSVLVPMTLVACGVPERGAPIRRHEINAYVAGCSSTGPGAPAAAVVALVATLAALRLARRR
jgi:uncharacterized protein (TIGR03382 family)